LLVSGDLIYADASEDVKDIAKPAVLLSAVGCSVVAGLHTIALRPTRNNSLFLFYCSMSPIFREQVRKRANGLKVIGISAAHLQDTYISLPENAEEEEIGNFFKALDSLIAAHERKLELLKKKKNYYLQQIFSQKIRLKGFNDPWKQRKLLSCVEKILDFRGRTPKKLGLKWSTSGFLALSALNVKQGYIDKEVPTYHGDCQLYKRWMGDSTLHKGQVVFTTEAPMGNVAQIPDNEKYILSQRTIAFELSAKILQDSFLALLLISPEVRKMLMQKTSGATAQGISQKTLAELVLSIPNLTEQNYVSSFFQVLNELIYMEQRKQTLLKQQKQAYLQKMFV
jgi:type I restriction enzyme S subunit